MIVNTAYIYMGGGAAVNPNLWQDGVANYPVEFKNSSISSNGLKLNKTGSDATFSELQLTGFNSLTISFTSLIDMLVMFAAGLLVYGFTLKDQKVTKQRGIVLLVFYFAYVGYLLVR